MHILYIHQHFATPDNSIGTRSYELSRRLIDAGHQVTMLCGDTVGAGDGSSKRIVKETIDGINVIRVMQPYSNNMGFLSRVFSFVKFAISASACAYKERPDFIYATSTPLTVGIPAIISQLKTKAPFVFEVRDLWPTLPVAMGVIKNPLIIWLLRKLETTIYRRSDAVVTLAPGMENEIRTVKGAPQNIKFIPNGCDTDLFNPESATAALPEVLASDNRFKLVYCGHHGIANGLHALINAAVVLKEQNQKNILFVMIGSGSEKAALMKDCTEKGVDEYFNWMDPIPKKDLAAMLPKMGAGVMPLMNVTAFHNGTSPNKFFDYISSGLPVIINYPGWIGELIEGHNCGISVTPDQPLEFANAAIKLSKTSDQERAAMSANSRSLAMKDFARENLGQDFVSFLEDVYRSKSK